jgi:gas vesicle protein
MLFEDWDENADQYSTDYKLAVARIAKNQSDIAMKLAEDTTEEFKSDVRQNKEKIDQIVENIEGDLSKDVSKNGQLRFDELADQF